MSRLSLLILLFSPVILNAQEVKVIKFPELQKKIVSADASVTVFNFWATWCGPCVKELPHFESYHSDPNVKVYLISLDFSDKLDKVEAFVADKKLKSEVMLLDETDYNSFMDKISKEWSGAIPATLFVDEWGKTYMHEGEMSKEELTKKIKLYSNKP